jgi:hypothetical protein
LSIWSIKTKKKFSSKLVAKDFLSPSGRQICVRQEVVFGEHVQSQLNATAADKIELEF